MQVIETFVCQLYGKPSHTSVDKVRYDKVKQCFKDKKASSSNFPDLPKPENNRWRLNSSGGLEIKWFSKDFIPKELQDILPDTLGTDDALEKELQDDDFSSHEESISDTDDEL
ncbi:hypothetical protein PoB_003437900 [Plakobranchus ocellatus]|uniref:Uncharacterized protein n=1 Tax=Plakobranchus ocellatus TaxID=259542 RepID=A0AAV4ANU2_9GAST|nr:hypothetical protein PoB_003437900 [Plakobranchus ocellatus]